MVMPSAADTPGDFYAELAGAYDGMTDERQRAATAEAFLNMLAEERPFESMLDVACGTGVYALAAATGGVDVCGTDLCREMLEQARVKAVRAGLKASWLCMPMQQLAAYRDQAFDLVLCMGNSLPHLLTDTDVADTLAGFRQCLRPGGRAVVQLLNYDRILTERERIVSIDRSGQREFVRFYDFLPGGMLIFNLLTIDWSAEGAPQHALRSVRLRAFTSDRLSNMLVAAGFRSCDVYGNLSLGPFAAHESPMLVLLARC